MWGTTSRGKQGCLGRLNKNNFSLLLQINNPDMRVQILKDFVKQHFPSTQLLDYALDVEKITTSKVRFIIHHPGQWWHALFLNNMILFCPCVDFIVLETQLDPERGWLHWCSLCGLTQDLWWFHKVSRQILIIFMSSCSSGLVKRDTLNIFKRKYRNRLYTEAVSRLESGSFTH